jgi:hypothetical protein
MELFAMREILITVLSFRLRDVYCRLKIHSIHTDQVV